MTGGPRPTLCGLVLPRARLSAARLFWLWRLFGESERVPIYEYPQTFFPDFRSPSVNVHTHGMAY